MRSRMGLTGTALALSLLFYASGFAAPSATSDETAEVLLVALRAREYATAVSLFDATMKAALPEAKLEAVWVQQARTLGPLRSWAAIKRAEYQGKDLCTAVLQFERGQLQASIAIDPQSQQIAGFFLRPVPPPSPPAAYVDPSKFHVVDLQVGSEPFVLGGTLTVPTLLDPVPGIVLVHGSGPNDRDETVGANKVFKDLAEGLASRGIAVLRYDKRTYRYGPKLKPDISVDEEVTTDAVAALRALKARPEVDSNRVFVIGHSLGALMAPKIAKLAAPLAGAVLLAPPGRAPWDLLLSQARYLDTPKKDMADLEAKVDQAKRGTLQGSLLGAPQSYWRDLAAQDGIGIARELGKPILVLRGDRDYQVLSEDLEAWKKGLAGVSGAQFTSVAGANHLFILGKGKPGPAEYGQPGHVDASVIDRISAFVSSISGTNRAGPQGH
jgi:uncharacterized protein